MPTICFYCFMRQTLKWMFSRCAGFIAGLIWCISVYNLIMHFSVRHKFYWLNSVHWKSEGICKWIIPPSKMWCRSSPHYSSLLSISEAYSFTPKFSILAGRLIHPHSFIQTATYTHLWHFYNLCFFMPVLNVSWGRIQSQHVECLQQKDALFRDGSRLILCGLSALIINRCCKNVHVVHSLNSAVEMKQSQLQRSTVDKENCSITSSWL